MQRKKATLAQKKARGDRSSGKSKYAQKVAHRSQLAHDMGAPVAPLPVLEHGDTEEEAERKRKAAAEEAERNWLPPVDVDAAMGVGMAELMYGPD